MKKKTTLTKMHIAPSTVRYDAVAARDSNEVGQILAGTRKRNGYSLVTFSELLRHYGVDVSDKGISKWEKGYTTPSIYQLVAICYALNIKEGPSYFTKNFQKPALLNDIGQKKVAEYEMDLIASRRYQPDAEEPAEIDYIMMPVSELPVSAGLGAFLEGEMFQQIQVPASSVPAGAEFGIYVSGDSMEPRYHNGQIVAGMLCDDRKSFADSAQFLYRSYDIHENKFVENTTIGAIITNAAFTKSQLCKIAGMTHNGYARSIRPVHTSADGDSIYALSVGNIPADCDMVGTLAADVMAEAILCAIRNTESAYGFPAYKDLSFI